MTKEINLNFKATKEDREDFMAVAAKIDVPFSQIAREAIRERVAEIKRTHPKYQTEQAQVNTNA